MSRESNHQNDIKTFCLRLEKIAKFQILFISWQHEIYNEFRKFNVHAMDSDPILTSTHNKKSGKLDAARISRPPGLYI